MKRLFRVLSSYPKQIGGIRFGKQISVYNRAVRQDGA